MRHTFTNPALAELAAIATRYSARMEWLDAQCLLSDAQALTATAVSTNAYDSTVILTDIGVGEQLCIEFSVDVAADFTTGDETYTFGVITSAATNLGTATVLASRAVLATALTLGAKFYIPIPPGKILRYVGAAYTLAGTTPSVTITANIKPVSMTETLKYNAKNYTIS